MRMDTDEFTDRFGNHTHTPDSARECPCGGLSVHFGLPTSIRCCNVNNGGQNVTALVENGSVFAYLEFVSKEK